MCYGNLRDKVTTKDKKIERLSNNEKERVFHRKCQFSTEICLKMYFKWYYKYNSVYYLVFHNRSFNDT